MRVKLITKNTTGVKKMYKLNDYCNGTLAGAIGFFASRVDLPIPAQLAINGAMTGLASLMLHSHPVYKQGDHVISKLFVALGALTPIALGAALDYGLQSPEFINHPLIFTCLLVPQMLALFKNLPEDVYEYSSMDDELTESGQIAINSYGAV